LWLYLRCRSSVHREESVTSGRAEEQFTSPNSIYNWHQSDDILCQALLPSFGPYLYGTKSLDVGPKWVGYATLRAAEGILFGMEHGKVRNENNPSGELCIWELEQSSPVPAFRVSVSPCVLKPPRVLEWLARINGKPRNRSRSRLHAGVNARHGPEKRLRWVLVLYGSERWLCEQRREH